MRATRAGQGEGACPRAWTWTALLASAVAAALPAAGPVAAQAPEAVRGALVGMVLDERDLEPLEGVLVALHDFTRRDRTDEEGRFALDDLPPGRMVVRLEQAGYITLVEEVEVTSAETTLIQFRLRRLTAMLDELRVDVEGSGSRGRGHAEGEIPGVYGEEVHTAADLLLRSVPGLSASRADGMSGAGLRIRLRGVSSISLPEDPSIYLDGIRIDAGGQVQAIRALDQIPASAVRRIRVLRGPASTALYANAASGVILVETFDEGRPPPGGP